MRSIRGEERGREREKRRDKDKQRAVAALGTRNLSKRLHKPALDTPEIPVVLT